MKPPATRTWRLVSLFPRKTVLVVGDVMLDHFVVGDVTRINPEAPVPVLRVQREYFAPGGAANAAANVASLGGKVLLVGYVGDDVAGRKLATLLRERRIRARLVTTQRPTTTKVRAIARGQQLLRLDHEADGSPSRRGEAAVLAQLEKWAPRADAVLVSDYDKGLVTERLLRALTGDPMPCPIVTVDPKPAHIDFYRKATLITPNTKEAAESARLPIRDDEDLRRIGRLLSDRLSAHVLITRGEHGMSCFSRGDGGFDLPTVAQEVADVTGAGDTVIAAVTLALAAGASLLEAVTISNVAAGIKVSKVGTAAVTAAELTRALRGRR
jgi:D-glycero-beta-D-manno-heptose-7-phosphate kinase